MQPHPKIFDDTTYMLYLIRSDYMGLTAKQVMKILKQNGWEKVRIEGSHHIFEKEGFERPIPVPFHGNKDLGDFGKKILKEANINYRTKKEN